MTNIQKKMILSIYKKPQTLSALNKRYKLYLEFENCDYLKMFDHEFEQYIEFRKDTGDFGNSLCVLNNAGITFAENEIVAKRKHSLSELRGWITAAIAVAAFIKSFWG